MRAAYNEIDRYCCDWLANLIDEGLIAPGAVLDTDIRDLDPGLLRGFTRVHLFAGIGGWDHALNLAGWPSAREVWTASCPCQPFSGAGQGAGFADSRHLWPDAFRLIRERRPPTIFGEQVEGPAGRAWLDLVFADLEGAGYACGAVVFPAAGVGAPHQRHRTYWVAQSGSAGVGRFGGKATHEKRRTVDAGTASLRYGDWAASRDRTRARGTLGGLADANLAGSGIVWRTGLSGDGDAPFGHDLDRRGAPDGFWSDADWLFCRDNKWRPVEPGAQPLAHGAPARVGRLRAYGNCIIAQAAAEFIGAYLDLASGA